VKKNFKKNSDTKETHILAPFGTEVLHLIQINHQPVAKIFQFIILTFVYSSTCFERFPAHHQELYIYIIVSVRVSLKSQ